MPSYTKTAGFQTWEQEELNSAQFKTYVYIEIFYSANLGNAIAFPDDFPVVGPRPSSVDEISGVEAKLLN